MRFLHLLLSILLLGSLPAGAQSYDPEAELQRLIARAREEKSQASQDLEKLKAAEQRSKQDFLTLNDTAYQLGQTLKRIRTIDARNKAIMLVKTGLNITAVNAPEKLLEVGVNITVDAGSEALKNNFPGLFDTSVTVELPRLGADSVKAVKEFNDVLAYSDEDVSDRLKKEVPELARDRGALYEFVAGGKLNDDLIAMKKAQYLIQAGTKAEAALNALKALLGQKRQEQLDAIRGLEHKKKMLDEDIRVWEKSAGLAREVRELSKVPEPQKVQWVADAKYDFGTAAQKMRSAMDNLKANRYNCEGYYTELGNASSGAWNRFSELFRKMWAANCSDYSSDQCRRANAQFDATVRQDYVNQIDNTMNQLSRQLSEAANGPAGTFFRKAAKWRDTTVLVPGDWWDLKGREIRLDFIEGKDLAGAIFGYSLVISPEPIKDWYPPAVGGMTLEALRFPGYSLMNSVEPQLEHAQSFLKNFDIMLEYARKSAATGQQAAAEAEALAAELEPNRHFWACAAGLGDQTGTYLHLRRFSPTYTSAIAPAEQNAKQVHDTLQQGVNKTQSLISALSAEKGILEIWAKGEDLRYRLNEASNAAGAQIARNLSPYPLWSQLKPLGISSAGVLEIAEIIPRLSNPEEAIKDYNGRVNNPSGAGSRPVMRPEAITELTARLKKQGAAAIIAQNEYRDLYNQLAGLQSGLSSRVNSLKTTVENTTGKPSGIAAPVLLDENWFLAPNDLPDPTAGVFELLEKYSKVAAEYHAKLDALAPWTFGVYPEMEKLLKKVRQEGSGKTGGDPNSFRDWWNRASQEWSSLNRMASQNGYRQVPRTSPFGKLSSEVMAYLMELSNQVSSRERMSRASETLNDLNRRLNEFLARPEALGGRASAFEWIKAIDGADSSSEVAELRNHPAIMGLLAQIRALRPQLEKLLATGADEMVRKFYQDFAAAYQSRNLPQLLRFLAPDWQTDNGSDVRDLETTLGNSFRVFDRIQVSISGLSVQRVDSGYQASYTIRLTGSMQRMKKNHEESSQVVDTLILTPAGLKIHRSSGGLNWAK